jgi:hypothetical protein
MSLAQSFAHVLGPRTARTPSNLPILIASPVFDDETTNSILAIAQQARKQLGIEVYLPHWQLISRYSVKDGAAVKTGHGAKRIPFDVARVYRYLPEAPMRKQLGISEDDLDHIARHRAWWAVKTTD